MLAPLLAGVYVSLCPLPQREPCPMVPVLLEAEVASDQEDRAAVHWVVDGKPVATDQLNLRPFALQRLALELVPKRPGHEVAVQVETAQGTVRAALSLPPGCFFWLQLASFAWDASGLKVWLVNAGPSPSFPVLMRWSLNGLPLSQATLDPLPPQASLQLVLPAGAHPLLEAVLLRREERRKRAERGVPVLVALSLWTGQGDGEAAFKQWLFYLGQAPLPGGEKSP